MINDHDVIPSIQNKFKAHHSSATQSSNRGYGLLRSTTRGAINTIPTNMQADMLMLIQLWWRDKTNTTIAMAPP